jgi:hypothetical protein
MIIRATESETAALPALNARIAPNPQPAPLPSALTKGSGAPRRPPANDLPTLSADRAAVADGARLVWRAVVGGVAAALVLSALTLVVAKPAAAATSANVAVVRPIMAPINADTTVLLAKDGERMVPAPIATAHLSVVVESDRAVMTSTRTFWVDSDGLGWLQVPLPENAQLDEVWIQTATDRVISTQLRNDAGYDEDWLFDQHGRSRLTYALPRMQGEVIVRVTWSQPLIGSHVSLALAARNANERIAPLVLDPDAADGCGPHEPISWEVTLAPEWRVTGAFAGTTAVPTNVEQGRVESWIWAAGQFADTPAALQLELKRDDDHSPRQQHAKIN